MMVLRVGSAGVKGKLARRDSLRPPRRPAGAADFQIDVDALPGGHALLQVAMPGAELVDPGLAGVFEAADRTGGQKLASQRSLPRGR